MDYKYGLSVCLCIKDEAKYMPDFIEHYLKQGVDHFYIINNNSNDNIQELCNEPQYKDIVTLITDNRNMGILQTNSSAHGHQTLLNQHFYPIIIQETKWAIIVDADEFMFGKNGFTLKTYISQVPDHIGTIYVIWNIINPAFDSENNIVSTFSTQQNTKRINYDKIGGLSWLIKNANDFGKSIVRTSMLSEEHKLWLHKNRSKGTVINNYGYETNNNYDNCNGILLSEQNYADINISLHHYAIRNADDYVKKLKQLDAVSEKIPFIKGLFEILALTDEYLVSDTSLLLSHK